MEKNEIEKIKNQIAIAQKYLLSFSPNAKSSSDGDRYMNAYKQTIFELKEKIGDTSPTYVLGSNGPIEVR